MKPDKWTAKRPVRLLVACPTCRSTAVVDRIDWMQAQTFCSIDQTPMTVVGTVLPAAAIGTVLIRPDRFLREHAAA